MLHHIIWRGPSLLSADPCMSVVERSCSNLKFMSLAAETQGYTRKNLVGESYWEYCHRQFFQSWLQRVCVETAHSDILLVGPSPLEPCCLNCACTISMQFSRVSVAPLLEHEHEYEGNWASLWCQDMVLPRHTDLLTLCLWAYYHKYEIFRHSHTDAVVDCNA